MTVFVPVPGRALYANSVPATPTLLCQAGTGQRIVVKQIQLHNTNTNVDRSVFLWHVINGQVRGINNQFVGRPVTAGDTEDFDTTRTLVDGDALWGHAPDGEVNCFIFAILGDVV